MKQINLTLGITMGGFSLLMLAAYFGLVVYFEFPDILRAETSHMLSVFQRNQNAIVLFYYLFVISQIVFVAIILQLGHYFRNAPSMLLTISGGFGVLAGLCQAIGFLRWPFLVPYLASIVSDPTASIVSKETANIVLQSFHQFSGVAIGENLFFIFEGVWGICLGVYLIKYRLLSRPLSIIPLVAGVIIIVYSLEQFGGSMAVLAPLNVIGHGALVFWFLALSKIFLQHSMISKSRNRNSQNINHHTRVGKITVAFLWITYLGIVTPGLI